MAARNDITGDSLVNSKGDRNKFRNGWELIWGNKEVNQVSEADVIVQGIIAGTIDIYNVFSRPSTAAEIEVSKTIAEMYDEAVIEYHLHPDDDCERILERVQEQLEANNSGK